MVPVELAPWLLIAAGLVVLLGGLRLASRSLGGAEATWLRAWLRRVTARPLGAAAAGLVATVCLQSSSVSTIAFVGLVDAGLLGLEEAAGLIVGANVGTTLAVQFLAWRPHPWVPYALLLVAVPLAVGRTRLRRLGRGALGAALLLLGLGWIEAGAAILAHEPWFGAAVYAVAGSPWLGAGAGALLTGVVMSSTLTIGVLQRLVGQGWVPLAAALAVLCGANIGTTSDTLLASLGSSRDAQRAAVFHLLFNVVGTLIFLAGLPWATAALRAGSADPARQIANAHLLFNLAAGAAVLPGRRWLLALVRLLLPDRPGHPAA